MFLICYLRLCAVLIGVLTVSQLFAQNVSFVVGADNREYTTQYRAVLREINDMTVNPEPSMSFPQFFVACGDIDPVSSNMVIYNDTLTYPSLPPYYPVVGNHEFDTVSDLEYVLNVMLPDLSNVVNRGQQGTYSFDYSNVHCIVLDQYNTNPAGEVDANLRVWIQQDLNMTNQDHVFVFAHEPAFPRHRNVGGSLDRFPESRNAFWEMLVLDPRVRAFFCGHTHYYYRMRVVDPASVGTSGLPDQEGGVLQVDVGAIGNPEGDGNLTLVYVDVQQDSIRFRTIQSPRVNIQWGVADEWSIQGIKRFAMQMLSPLAGNEIAGNTLIEWSTAQDLAPTLTTILYVSRDAGASWDTLGTTQIGETAYVWDTDQYPDGLNYMLRIFTKNDSGFGMVQSTGVFTINNPGNGLPDIELLSPQKGDFITGAVLVKWNAADVDGDMLSFSMDYSVNGGLNLYPAFSNLQNTDEYLWDTNLAANSPNCRVVLRCYDGTVEVRDTSDVFEILNEREEIAALEFTHIAGRGGGIIKGNIINESLLTGNLYRIIFDDTSFSYKAYNIINVDTGEEVVRNAAELDGVSEGPFFDGIRLLIKDLEQVEVDIENTGWQKGSCTWNHSVFVPTLWIGSETIEGFPYPADYKITIFDEVVDTSKSLFNVPEIPMKFLIWNITEDRKSNTLFIDNDNDQSISVDENVFVLEDDDQGELQITWKVLFTKAANDSMPIAPQAGDEFVFTTFNPFANSDIYEFRGIKPISIGDNMDVVPEEMTLFPNYPNPFNPTTTISYYVPKLMNVRITIYNVLGQEVIKLIDGLQTSGMKTVRWNGKNSNRDLVNSGVYFCRILAGGQTDVRKMLLLR